MLFCGKIQDPSKLPPPYTPPYINSEALFYCSWTPAAWIV